MNNDFFGAYVRTALWSSTDESDESGGRPMDENYSESDIAPEALAKMQADCEAFLAHPTVVGYLTSDDYADIVARDVSPIGRVAHDFWLTRNGHGAGFWDGDYPEPWGERLTEAAQSFGECNLYIGDDGLIYIG